jgi:anti-sigma regulatory factor (Ser/Thr protein kinase)
MTQSHRQRERDAGSCGPAAGTQVRLRCHPSSVRDAGSFIHRYCRPAGVAGEAREPVFLLTSEVVTNAFLHGRSDARLRANVAAGRMRVEVGDDSSHIPHPVEQHRDATNGRGLVIVDALADARGTCETIRPRSHGGRPAPGP